MLLTFIMLIALGFSIGMFIASIFAFIEPNWCKGFYWIGAVGMMASIIGLVII